MGLLAWLTGRRTRKHAAAVFPPVPRPRGRAKDGGFAVVDLETTGLNRNRDRIVEIAVVRTDPLGNVVDEWATLVNPDGPVTATSVHGISESDVRAAPRFAHLVGELNARLAGRAIVAHNAAFDLGFLGAEYARAGWELPAAPHLCTLAASRLYLPDLDRRRLHDCCWEFQVALSDAHSALGDARATASLLACYLQVACGLRPPPPHLGLPGLAAAVDWPPIPVTTVPIVPRRPHAETVVAAPAGTLWTLLDALPLSSAVENGAPDEATEYLELLFEVLEDGVLTESEARSLAEVARLYSLTRAQVEAAHRGFMLALAHRIVEDGKVTKSERRMLADAAAALGVADDLPDRVLDEARAAWEDQRTGECRPLPPHWPYGEPLRIGQAIAFTGCDPIHRARLEGRAQAVGLRVTGSVSGRTAALVTDGANPDTTKARRARELGTRVVTPEIFTVLVDHVQPSVSPGTDPEPAPVPPDERPATVRAWARAHGFDVGVRGRIPANVRDAYREAHDVQRPML